MSTILIAIPLAWLALAAFMLALCRSSARSERREARSPARPGSQRSHRSSAISIQPRELGRRRPPPSRRPGTARGFLRPVALPEARGHSPVSPRHTYRDGSRIEPHA
jgi:hypothetical protein